MPFWVMIFFPYSYNYINKVLKCELAFGEANGGGSGVEAANVGPFSQTKAAGGLRWV